MQLFCLGNVLVICSSKILETTVDICRRFFCMLFAVPTPAARQTTTSQRLPKRVTLYTVGKIYGASLVQIGDSIWMWHLDFALFSCLQARMLISSSHHHFNKTTWVQEDFDLQPQHWKYGASQSMGQSSISLWNEFILFIIATSLSPKPWESLVYFRGVIPLLWAARFRLVNYNHFPRINPIESP